jgi:hypothetical protein
MGYHRAGFDVTGVDIAPQPRYLLSGASAFVQADALGFVAEHGREFDAIHASPPCQHYANVTRWRGRQDDHPDLIPATRLALDATGLPWVIENVPGAPVRPDVVLCGSQFGLRVIRHRWFETSWGMLALVPPCDHRDFLPFAHKGERAYANAMGCDWMTKVEAREAIPPAYTEWIGRQLLAAVVARTAA